MYPRVLALGHGDSYDYSPTHHVTEEGFKYIAMPCETTGLPIRILKKSDTLDINPKAKPTIVQDIRIPLNSSPHIYDIVTTVCFGGFVHDDRKFKLIQSAFENVHKLLKQNGYFILSTQYFIFKILSDTKHENPKAKEYIELMKSTHSNDPNTYVYTFETLKRQQYLESCLIPLVTRLFNDVCAIQLKDMFAVLSTRKKNAFFRTMWKKTENDPAWRELTILVSI